MKDENDLRFSSFILHRLERRRAMDVMPAPDQGGGIEGAPHFGDDPAVEVRAWEQVEAGRYMPRRIKGSCKGRALG
jgi:hypothetical protein